MRNRLFSAVALLTVIALNGAVAVGQYEPAVRVRVALNCNQNQCGFGEGNGVIIGNNGSKLLIVTAKHMLRDSRSVMVQVRGQWVTVQVANVSESADFAILTSDGNYNGIPAASLATQEPPQGAEVLIDGYWPSPWRRLVERRQFLRMGWLSGKVVQGVSGSGVVYDGKLAGIVVAVSLQPNAETLIVPSTTIRQQLTQWGYSIPSPSRPVDDATPSPLVNATPGRGIQAIPDGCNNCTERFESITVRLGEHDANWLKQSQINSQLNIRINELNQQITNIDVVGITDLVGLQTQIDQLRSELAELKPLANRRVVLVADGKVTSERTLKPSDPLVLGSEIVVRKNAGN